MALALWTLIGKNFRIVLLRRPVRTIFLALVLPIAVTTFLAYAQNINYPPAHYGIGEPRPILPLRDALGIAAGVGRSKALIVHEDSRGVSNETDPIRGVLDILEAQLTDAGADVKRLGAENALSSECPTSLRGVSQCYGAVVFSPPPPAPEDGSAGSSAQWNYTIRSDPVLSGLRVDIGRSDNDAEVYILPLQRAVDVAIAMSAGNSTSGSGAVLDNMTSLPFTDRTAEERRGDIRRTYQDSIHNALGVAFFICVMIITYHLTGFIATERELGMAQLIDAMMLVKARWRAQASRHVAHILSFSLIYLPGWVIGAIVLRTNVFPATSPAVMIIYILFSGISLACMSVLFASIFKKAQLSGITALLAAMLLAIMAQSLTAPDTVTVAILSALFSPCNFVYFIRYVSLWQKDELPANLAEAAPNSEVTFPGIVFFALLVIQMVAYPALGGIIESAMHGSDSSGRSVVYGGASPQIETTPVHLDRFTKTYPPSLTSRLLSRISGRPRNPVVAVDELTMGVGRGQIVILLGANGSGKSTTLDCIGGLSRMTSGSITIDGSGGLGIAPQKNVLWDDLTVEEHVAIFCRLKSRHGIAPQDVRDLICSVDLEVKYKARAGTLSGGQKRKLQLAMMLAGGSAVCCIDEVSSGIDPLSRRKIWDILLAERGRRTILMTTHFLDEADLLADHIVIMSKGTMRAQGSSVELKNTSGGGYRMIVPLGSRETDQILPDVAGVRREVTVDGAVYQAPSSSLAATVVRSLDASGITNYRFSGPTIEDVFLALADEISKESALKERDRSSGPQRAGGDDDGGNVGLSTDDEKNTGVLTTHENRAKLLDGTIVGYPGQLRIMFWKRMTVLKRNWPAYMAAFAIPIAAAGLLTLYLRDMEPLGCSPSSGASTGSTAVSIGDEESVVSFLFGPETSGLTSQQLDSLIKSATSAQNVTSNMVSSYDEFRLFIDANYATLTAGVWLGDSDNAPTIAYKANTYLGVAAATQNLADALLTRRNITTQSATFDKLWVAGLRNAIQVIAYMGIALVIYPPFFALYPSVERRRFVRSLQYSHGIRPAALWAAYLVFDFAIVAFATAIAIALWAGLSAVWWEIGYVFVVFLLYGLASVLLSYLFSLVGKSQLSTFGYATAWQGVVFFAYFIAFMVTVTNAPPNKTDRYLDIVHFTLSILAPVASALRAMFLTLNVFSVACDGHQFASYPGGMSQYGGPVLYLLIQTAAYLGILLYIECDTTSLPWSRGRLRSQSPSQEGAPDALDLEVAKESARVTSQEKGSDDGLRAVHLTKSFGKNTAVDNVTFGIRHGEVFALLGPNGAGKSTTISLIRGDMMPSTHGGDVFIEGKSVSKQLASARRCMGVCPQVDALDLMTVSEHLEFYARMRGVADVPYNVLAITKAVGLEAFSGRMADTLSGGNKRKLSLGIALMGNPSVILLDEPSSGLDAAAKRIMWKTLAATVPGRSILLTTHSMEEASALADRAGIMAKRMLALGTIDGLRQRFSDDLRVQLVCKTAPRTTDGEIAIIETWIQAMLPEANIEDKSYHGQLRFSVPVASVPTTSAFEASDRPQKLERQDLAGHIELGSGNNYDGDDDAHHDASHSAIGRLAVLLEENKASLGIEHFSVGRNTLDQVFLTIVGKHNVQEEDYGASNTNNTHRLRWCWTRREPR